LQGVAVVSGIPINMPKWDFSRIRNAKVGSSTLLAGTNTQAALSDEGRFLSRWLRGLPSHGNFG